LYLTGFVQNSVTKQVHKGFKLQLGYSIHTSVEDQALIDKSMKVYPNPASQSCVLELPLNTGTSVGDWTIQLTDLQGRTSQLLANQISDLGANRIELDLSHIREGLYHLTISSTQARTTYSHKIFKIIP
jgi:hypothetical protein